MQNKQAFHLALVHLSVNILLIPSTFYKYKYSKKLTQHYALSGLFSTKSFILSMKNIKY